MVDIHEQKEFNLLEEEKDIVLVNNTKHPIVKKIDELFDGKLKDNTKDLLTTIPTFGKLKSKKLHVVNYKKLKEEKNKNDIYGKIASLKGEICVLIDTFECDDYLEIVQDLSEKVLTKNYTFNKYKSENPIALKVAYWAKWALTSLESIW